MYCIKCGVELADSEEKCPLCGLKPYHPELSREVVDKPYPNTIAEALPSFKRIGVMFLLTGMVLLLMLMLMMIDFSVNHGMTWSAFVLLSIGLVYVVLFLPQWFERINSVIFMSVDVVATGIYLAMVCLVTGGHWFFSFAMPMVLIYGGISIVITVIAKYVKKGYLYLSGGSLIAMGIGMVIMELLLNVTFGFRDSLVWSHIPLVIFSIIGIMLIVIAIVKPLRDALTKKFFL